MIKQQGTITKSKDIGIPELQILITPQLGALIPPDGLRL
jgi:hypothetical protein